VHFVFLQRCYIFGGVIYSFLNATFINYLTSCPLSRDVSDIVYLLL
jgi:hypothetical protein